MPSILSIGNLKRILYISSGRILSKGKTAYMNEICKTAGIECTNVAPTTQHTITNKPKWLNQNKASQCRSWNKAM